MDHRCLITNHVLVPCPPPIPLTCPWSCPTPPHPPPVAVFLCLASFKVFEETGVSTCFDGILFFRQQHKMSFGGSDL